MKLPPNFSILFSWRAINRSKPARALLLTLTLWAAAFTPAQAQFRIPGLKLPDIPGVKIPGLPELNIPGPETLFKEEEPVTTSIKDVRGEVPYLDAYAPKRFRPLSSLRRGPNGGWLLQPTLQRGHTHLLPPRWDLRPDARQRHLRHFQGLLRGAVAVPAGQRPCRQGGGPGHVQLCDRL